MDYKDGLASSSQQQRWPPLKDILGFLQVASKKRLQQN